MSEPTRLPARGRRRDRTEQLGEIVTGGGASPPVERERPAPPVGGGDDGSSVYAAFIHEQVTRQDQRKQSLESRGITVITTAGAIAALLVGLTAFSTKSNTNFQIPHSAELSLRFAVILFAFAAVLALLTNVPLPYREAEAGSLRQLIDTSWDDPAEEARRHVSLAQLATLQRAKIVNARKVMALFSALALEVLGLVAVAVAVWIIV